MAKVLGGSAENGPAARNYALEYYERLKFNQVFVVSRVRYIINLEMIETDLNEILQIERI